MVVGSTNRAGVNVIVALVLILIVTSSARLVRQQICYYLKLHTTTR
jgi:hypothetical protein